MLLCGGRSICVRSGCKRSSNRDGLEPGRRQKGPFPVRKRKLRALEIIGYERVVDVKRAAPRAISESRHSRPSCRQTLNALAGAPTEMNTGDVATFPVNVNEPFVVRSQDPEHPINVAAYMQDAEVDYYGTPNLGGGGGGGDPTPSTLLPGGGGGAGAARSPREAPRPATPSSTSARPKAARRRIFEL